MREVLETAKDFKIIPNNFTSSGEFEVLSADENEIKIKLNLPKEANIEDYKPGSTVEIFGVNNVGLVYFETVVINKEGYNLTLASSDDYSVIQRREYSRVNLEQGKLVFKDMASDFVIKVEDISAGGIKFVCSGNLEIDKYYDIEITLSNNMKIDCSLQPIRISEKNGKYTVSGKFVNIENVDRIVLVQYAFKIKMEEQNTL